MVLRMLDEHYVIGICTKGTRPTLDLFLEKFGPILREHEESVRIVIAVNGDGELVLADYPNVSVVREPRLGIAYARNRVLQEIGPNENLIFIDDDEYPDQDWFPNLIAVHKKFPGDLVVGPVREVDSSGDIVADSKIRPISNTPTGTLRKTAATNNLLIPYAVLNSGFVYFDLFFNHGGSDSDLSFRLINRGFKIRWVADAIMYEVEDADRVDVEWAYRRDRRNAAIYSVVIKRNSTFHFMLMYFVKKLMQFSVYSILQFTSSSNRRKFELYKIGLKALLTGKQTG